MGFVVKSISKNIMSTRKYVDGPVTTALAIIGTHSWMDFDSEINCIKASDFTVLPNIYAFESHGIVIAVALEQNYEINYKT